MNKPHSVTPRCSCSACCGPRAMEGMTCRLFLGGVTGAAAATSWALGGLTWPLVSAAEGDVPAAPQRKPLVVKPVLIYDVPRRRPQTSWRSWGGIMTQQDADGEVQRIGSELAKMKAEADFPLEFLPLAALQDQPQLNQCEDLKQADAVILYPAGGSGQLISAVAAAAEGKPMIVFVRHRSGPVYLWYEIISPRYLRQHSDQLADVGADYEDVVVDEVADVVWRLRALCGLKNTRGTRIVAVGGPSGWGPQGRPAPDLARQQWNMDIRDVSYDELGQLIQAARRPGCRRPGRQTSARVPATAAGETRYQGRLCQKRISVGEDLPRSDDPRRCFGDYDQSLHGHNHAAFRNDGLSSSHAA